MNKRTAPKACTVRDARKLKPEEQHVKRNQVVQLYVRGLSPQQIAAATGMSATAVARITKLYKSGGEAALAPQLRGRRIGPKRTGELAQAIQNFICGGGWGTSKNKS